jgi:anthranilate synthase component 1
MPVTNPLSLGEVRRLAAGADTVLLRAERDADLETPIGAFMRLDDGGPAYLLESVEGGDRLGRYSFLGVGPRRILTVDASGSRIQVRPVEETRWDASLPVEDLRAADPLDALRRFVPRRRVEPLAGMPRFIGGAVGALAYDAVSTFEPTVPLPDRDPVGVPLATFLESDLVLVFDHLAHTLSAIASLHVEAPRIEERYRIAERAIWEALERTARPVAAETAFRGPDLGAGPGEADGTRPGMTGDAGTGDSGDMPDTAGSGAGADEGRASLGRDAYEHAVVVAKEAIASGEAIQVVLARRQTLDLPAGPEGRPVDGLAVYRALRRVNPSPYLFFVRTPGHDVVGASPELLVRVTGRRVATHPIAGTRRRGADEAEDRRLAEELQADPKERAEHVMLVDLGRNDLGRVAEPGSVAVTRYMEVERYSHVLHLVSHVEAKLADGRDSLDALRSVFPAGTLSGAPKVRAMQLIARAEGERRGLYGGAVGYLGYDGDLDTAITIRSAVLKDGLAHIHAGAGIVKGSDPASEFRETEAKAAAMRRAIDAAGAGASRPEAEAGARDPGVRTGDRPDRAGAPGVGGEAAS